MALSLNTYLKQNLINSVRFSDPFSVYFAGTSTAVLRIFPATVPYPTNPVETVGALPAGHILSYGTITYTIVSNTLSITAGVTSANTTAAGTLSWFSICNTSSPANGAMISDSIGLSGQGKILTVNTLTPGNGQSVTISFNLSTS